MWNLRVLWVCFDGSLAMSSCQEINFRPPRLVHNLIFSVTNTFTTLKINYKDNTAKQLLRLQSSLICRFYYPASSWQNKCQPKAPCYYRQTKYYAANLSKCKCHPCGGINVNKDIDMIVPERVTILLSSLSI